LNRPVSRTASSSQAGQVMRCRRGKFPTTREPQQACLSFRERYGSSTSISTILLADVAPVKRQG
jgi:hypothetical protein